MRWRGKRQSRNIEDRRHMGATGMARGGGLLRLLPMALRFLGLKGTAVLGVGLVAYGLYTGNLGSILGLQQGTVPAGDAPLQQTAAEKELVDFVSVVLADTEDTWSTIFEQQGKRYQQPKLVLFRGSTPSACGLGQAATGPFYCPADQQVYIDLAFFEELKTRFSAPGDFAQAYVIAHEVGHHLQTLLGISARVHAAKQKLGEVEANKLSVRQELQADCLAGVWANHADRARQLLEQGDIEEGLRAASATGDDTLQKQARGYVTPDSFTHGSSAQRVKWFKIGLAKGSIAGCDTFNDFDAVLPDDFSVTPASRKPAADASGVQQIMAAYDAGISDRQVKGSGTVHRILPDDNDGSRHQKFILRLANGHTVLISHNIDLAPRIPDLKKGDRVAFYGEYEWSRQGGVVHWTHDDPAGRHAHGWLQHEGKRYH